MCPGSILQTSTTQTKRSRSERSSRNWISRFLRREGGASENDDESDEPGAADALDRYGELCGG